MINVQSLRNHVEQLKGRRTQILQDIENTENRLQNNTISLQEHEEAREIARLVGLKTQQQLQFHIGDITSLALEAVYDDPYRLVVEFVQRHNKTECDLFFERNNQRINPLTASGGGVVNIASFALRVASWSMQHPRSRATLILDEPFGNVSVDLLPRASEMLKQISQRLNLQIIMVTHAEELVEAADKVFKVTINKQGISTVTEGG